MKGPISTDFLEKGVTVNSASYCQPHKQYSPYLLNQSRIKYGYSIGLQYNSIVSFLIKAKTKTLLSETLDAWEGFTQISQYTGV